MQTELLNPEASTLFDAGMTDYLAPVVHRIEPILTRGKGSFVWDTDGRRYLDLCAGQFCAIFGHSNPRVADLVHLLAGRLQNTSTTTVSDESLIAARKLHDLTQDMDGRSVFLSTGAEANECCLRYAKHLTGRPGVVSFGPAWHGLTLGTESVSISRHHVKPQVPYSYSVPVPPGKCGGEVTEADLVEHVETFRTLMEEDGDRVAAAIFEPIVSSGGMYFPPAEYFQRVREICHRHGAYLVFDECQTGFARTGSWFHYQQLDCIPDFVVCAKGMGLGYPVSAVVFNGELVPEDGFRMQLYSSHQNDPFPCALASFAIDWIEKEGLLTRIQERGNYFLEGLRYLSKEFPMIHKPRGKGLMLAFDLRVDDLADYSTLSKAFLAAMLERGCLLQAANAGQTIRLLPSYLIEEEEIDLMLEALDETLRHADLPF